FWDKTGRLESSTGRVVLTMLEALGCRGPDSAGVALIGPEPEPGWDDVWSIRMASGGEPALERLEGLGRIVRAPDRSPWERQGSSLRCHFRPEPGVSADDLEQALGARRGGLEILSLGQRLDLVKQVGSPAQLEAAYGVSRWRGPLVIGHTRMST